MPINYDEIMSLKSENIEISYTDKDSILYGLGVGLGNDPMNMDELKYVYENGQIARVSQKITKTGGFLDSVFDKIAEVAIFLGILVGGFAEPYLVFLAITFSLLVSYTRSRAESLGVKLQGIGIGERAERLLVIAIIGIIGFMEYAVIIVIIIAGITFIQRIIVTVKALNQ